MSVLRCLRVLTDLLELGSVVEPHLAECVVDGCAQEVYLRESTAQDADPTVARDDEGDEDYMVGPDTVVEKDTEGHEGGCASAYLLSTGYVGCIVGEMGRTNLRIEKENIGYLGEVAFTDASWEHDV